MQALPIPFPTTLLSMVLLGHTNVNVSFSSPPASVLTYRCFCLNYCLEMPSMPPFCEFFGWFQVAAPRSKKPHPQNDIK